MNNKKYIRLTIKSLNEEITQVEKDQLNKWLESSEENQIQYKKIQQLWNSAIPEDPSSIPDKYEELSKLRELIDYRTKNATNPKISFSLIESLKFGFVRNKYRFAFVFSLIMLLSIGSWYLIIEKKTSKQMTEISTHNKQITQIRLPDSSYVKMNSASTLRYPSKFLASDRKVYLEGEAYFEVEKDIGKFEVETKNARIIVIGTKFNVSYRNGVTKVIVKDGVVQVDAKVDNKKTVQLTKGNMSSIEKNNLPTPPKEVNTEYMLGWMKGILVFEKTSLLDIIRELERFYDIKIEISNNELANKTLTASYDDAKLENVLSSICIALNVQYKIESGRYKIF